jgi:UPF0755 protein
MYRFVHTPLIPPGKSVDYIFQEGSSVRVLAYDLQKLGLLNNPNYLIVLAYWEGSARHLRAGEYLFVAGTTPTQLLDQIASGRVVYHQIVLFEGWNMVQFLAALNLETKLTHEIGHLSQAELMYNLHLSNQNPEGEFFPDTYRYTLGTTDKTLLLNAYHLMQKHLLAEWLRRDPTVPYQNPYQALIVASIIEKEAKLNNERSIIAGVIIRRLQQHILLGMDSTVIYGLGTNYKGQLTKDDLRLDTPYNTYIHPGLPPTPIAMPGLASIYAALHPTPGTVLYYVAKGDGSHQFSDTYQEQLQAISTYEHVH